MRKLIALFFAAIVLTACASGRYISMAQPQARFDAEQVLYQQYPDLVPYYEAGVLHITSLREVRSNGGRDYKLNYRFVRYNYKDYSERMTVLAEKFPEIYELYVNGYIELTSMYRYVDRNTLEIRNYVSYRRMDDPLYDYALFAYPYGGYHYYYIPRSSFPWYNPRPPLRHPGPDMRPNNPPRPDARPNNPPRTEPRPDNGRRPDARPNNPPRTEPRPQNNPPRQNVQPRTQSRPTTPPNGGGSQRANAPTRRR